MADTSSHSIPSNNTMVAPAAATVPNQPSRFSSVLTYNSLADKLPKYPSMILSHGKISAGVLIISYLVLLGCWFPLYALSLILTELGVYTGMILLMFKIGRTVLRLIAFPGASQRVYSDIESEFAKYALRLLESATNTCAETANLILTSQKSNKNGSNSSANGIKSGTITITLKREFPMAWSRTRTLRNRVFGMFVDVLHCLLMDEGTGNKLNTDKGTLENLTVYGNNRLVGDIGNLKGLTSQARQDGITISDLIIRIIHDIKALEDICGNVNNGTETITADGEIVSVARQMLKTTNELRDFLASMKRANKPSSDSADSDEDNVDSTNLQIDPDDMSTLDTIKYAISSILPMLDPPPHSSIFGLDVLRGCLLSRYKGAKQLWVWRPSGRGMIDVVHIPCYTNESRQKAILYCNPNAGFYEVATGMSLFGGNVGNDKNEESTSEETCWTDFYLENGYDVYLFNYAGYGRSYGTGLLGGKASKPTESQSWFFRLGRIMYSFLFDFTPAPSSLKEDSLTVARHLKGTLGIEKLIIHGESIGGMVAASTAKQLTSEEKRKKRRSDNDFNLVASAEFELPILICDRTFCNLIAVAQRLVGAWTGPVIKMLAPFWNTDVANDFLSANCPKLVCNDAADAIIADSSSLKSGIAEAMEMKRGYTSGVGMVKEPPLEYRMADFEDIGVQETKYATRASRRINAPVWPVDKHIATQEAFHFAACATRIGKVATAAKKNKNKNKGPRTLTSVRSSDSYESDGGDEGFEMTNVNSSRPTITQFVNDESDDSDKEEEYPTFLNSPNKDRDNRPVLIEMWNTLACCDGLCGAHLGFAVKNGPDCVVSWLCSAVTYGCQRVAGVAERRLGFPTTNNQIGETTVKVIPSDYDCKSEGFYEDEENNIYISPIPLPKVIKELKNYHKEHCSSRGGALEGVKHELQYCIGMLEYIVERTNSTLVINSALDSLHFRDSKQSSCTGSFLNLHCGHNNMFSTKEKDTLRSLLKEINGDAQVLRV